MQKQMTERQQRVRCRQQDQRDLRRQRKRLRELCAAEADGEALVDTEDVEELCKDLSKDKIEALCGAMEKAEGDEAKRSAAAAALEELYSSRGEVRWL